MKQKQRPNKKTPPPLLRFVPPRRACFDAGWIVDAATGRQIVSMSSRYGNHRKLVAEVNRMLEACATKKGT